MANARLGCFSLLGLAAPIRSCRWADWPSGSLLPLFGMHRFGVAARRVGLRAHCFRFSARTASELPLGGLAFGLTASAFRHAPLRSCPRRVGSSAFRFRNCPRRVGLRAHCFRFSARAVSEIALGGLAFGLTASAFRYAPLRDCHSAGWPSGSPLPLFGMRRSAPPCRRREGRRSTPTRHLFHFKTLISTC